MKEDVYNILKEVDDEIIQYDGEQMMEAGIIDSFMILEIAEALEEYFNIKINAEYISKENFANKDKIVGMVERVLKEQRKD